MIMGNQYIGALNDLIVVSKDRFLITKYMPYPDPMKGYELDYIIKPQAY